MAQAPGGPQGGLAVRRISASPDPAPTPAARTGPEYAKLIPSLPTYVRHGARKELE